MQFTKILLNSLFFRLHYSVYNIYTVNSTMVQKLIQTHIWTHTWLYLLSAVQDSTYCRNVFLLRSFDWSRTSPRGGTRTSRLSVACVCVIEGCVRIESHSHRGPAVWTVVVISSSVLTLVAAACGTVSTALQPVHYVLQMSTVAAALTPHKQTLHHMVANCTYTGTLVAPREDMQGTCQNSVYVKIE